MAFHINIRESITPFREYKISNQIEEIDVKIRESVQARFKLTKSCLVPLELKTHLMCKICFNSITTPVIFDKCCKMISGCEICVNKCYKIQSQARRQLQADISR